MISLHDKLVTSILYILKTFSWVCGSIKAVRRLLPMLNVVFLLMSMRAIHFITPPSVACTVVYLNPVRVVGEIPLVGWRIPLHVKQAWFLRRQSRRDAVGVAALIFVQPNEVRNSRMHLPFAASPPRLHFVSVLPSFMSTCVGNLTRGSWPWKGQRDGACGNRRQGHRSGPWWDTVLVYTST